MADAWLRDQLNKIESKIDNLDSRIDSVDVTLGKQSIILEEHTRRSLANEQQVELLKKKMEADKKDILEDAKPIHQHVHMINGAFKFIGGIATVAGIIGVAIKVAEFISSNL